MLFFLANGQADVGLTSASRARLPALSMITLSQLFIYPIKSCAGISLDQADIGALGLTADRRWMLIGADGHFLSQRSLPRLATIRTALGAGLLTVQAPGMPPLEVPWQVTVANHVAVAVWDDRFLALDCGLQARAWFSGYLGIDARLVQFDPAVQRVCSARWTGTARATTQFSDGYPILVTVQASLDDLNARLRGKGAPPLPMERFRPNLVLDGLEAFEEDHIDSLTLGAPGAEVVLRLVKPCTRCSMPGIDQRSGRRDVQWPNEPLDTLAQYRADARVGGALTFGQNAILVSGLGNRLRVGQTVQAALNF